MLGLEAMQPVFCRFCGGCGRPSVASVCWSCGSVLRTGIIVEMKKVKLPMRPGIHYERLDSSSATVLSPSLRAAASRLALAGAFLPRTRAAPALAASLRRKCACTMTSLRDDRVIANKPKEIIMYTKRTTYPAPVVGTTAVNHDRRQCEPRRW